MLVGCRTALAFSYLFGLFSQLSGMQSSRATLEHLGRQIGAALIRFDCAVDFARDQRRGEFNPLSSASHIRETLIQSAENLDEAATWARASWGQKAITVQILEKVRDRIVRGTTCSVGREPLSVRKLISLQFRRLVSAVSLVRRPVQASTVGDSDYEMVDEEGNPPSTQPPEESEKKEEPASNSGGCESCACCYSCECGVQGGAGLGECCQGAECCTACG